ncbi:MAG: hypothetical protein OXC57_10325 [Rhodobacteraceae bacterium]|nr:hypothetical protein [Paracoccaceae bacterium]
MLSAIARTLIWELLFAIWLSVKFNGNVKTISAVMYMGTTWQACGVEKNLLVGKVPIELTLIGFDKVVNLHNEFLRQSRNSRDIGDGAQLKELMDLLSDFVWKSEEILEMKLPT